MNYLFLFGFLLTFNFAYAKSFNKFVSSSSIKSECNVEKKDERGGFGIEVQEKETTHHLIVMTGVYYDTCMHIAKEINHLKRKYSHLLVQGTGERIESPTSRVWRFGSVRSPSGNECISYFQHDCPKPSDAIPESF